jgi:hypothetical protein
MSLILPSSFERLAQRLHRSQRGAAAVTFLLTSVGMIGGTLGGIDLIRYNIAESRLQDAVDATAISAAQALGAWDPSIATDKTAWQNYASSVFAANMRDGYLGSSINKDMIKTGITYTTDPPNALSGTPMSAQFVNVSVQGTLPLMSTGFFRIASYPIAAKNQVIRRLKNNTQIVLALEDSQYTGSGNTNIQTAAKNLVTAALGAMNQDGAQNIHVGVVPFSALVRMNTVKTPNVKNWVASAATALGTGVSTYVQGANWLGCIAEPLPPNIGYYWGQGGNPASLPASQLLPPGATGATSDDYFQPVFMPIPATSKNQYLGTFLSGNVTVTNSSGQSVTVKSSDYSKSNKAVLVPIQGHNGAQATPGQSANYRFIGVDINSTWGNMSPIIYSAMEPDSCAVLGKSQFLTQSQTDLNASINSMQGNAISEALIPGGLLWSWRMLTPTWKGAWDSTQPNLPSDASSDTPKAIVLLSLGKNTTANDAAGYRAPLMYNPASPAQTSHFELIVNYCADGTQFGNAGSGSLACNNGAAVQTGVVQQDTIITGNNTVGNNGQTLASQVPLWPVTSILSLDMRAGQANVVNGFAGAGSKLVGSHPGSAFEDTSATIGWPSGTTNAMDVTAANTYMNSVCTNIKADGITIYTVYVGGNTGNSTVMANCSSGPAYTFTSDLSNNLNSTFAAILGSMTQLRLTQ